MLNGKERDRLKVDGHSREGGNPYLVSTWCVEAGGVFSRFRGNDCDWVAHGRPP
jgi:hypothetical protein